jgi:hypothetical protein
MSALNVEIRIFLSDKKTVLVEEDIAKSTLQVGEQERILCMKL